MKSSGHSAGPGDRHRCEVRPVFGTKSGLTPQRDQRSLPALLPLPGGLNESTEQKVSGKRAKSPFLADGPQGLSRRAQPAGSGRLAEGTSLALAHVLKSAGASGGKPRDSFRTTGNTVWYHPEFRVITRGEFDLGRRFPAFFCLVRATERRSCHRQGGKSRAFGLFLVGQLTT